MSTSFDAAPGPRQRRQGGAVTDCVAQRAQPLEREHEPLCVDVYLLAPAGEIVAGNVQLHELRALGQESTEDERKGSAEIPVADVGFGHSCRQRDCWLAADVPLLLIATDHQLAQHLASLDGGHQCLHAGRAAAGG